MGNRNKTLHLIFDLTEQAKQLSAVWMEEPQASFSIKPTQELLEMNWR
jgi:hypothetical protein